MATAVTLYPTPPRSAMWAAAAFTALTGAVILFKPSALAVLPVLALLVALLRARQVWLLAVTLAYIPFSFFLEEFALGQEVGGAFNTLGMAKDLLHIAVFALIVGRSILRRESILVADTANRLFIAYFGWLLIHLINPTSLLPGFWAWRVYIEFSVFYLLVRAATETETDVRRLMSIWATLALPVMIFAVLKVVGGGLLEFYGQVDTWEGARLSFGGETNANHLALFLAPVVLGGLGLAWSTSSRTARVFWLVLAALAFVQTGLTLSRRAYLALVLGFAILAWYDRRRKIWFTLGLVAVAGMIPFLPAGIFDRFASMVNLTDYRNVGRFEEWLTVLEMVFAGPVQALWGVGPGRVGQVALDFKMAGAISSHNSYLLQLADLGLIGLGFLVAFFSYHIALAAKLAKKHRNTTLGKLAATLLAVQSAYALTAFFGITYHNYPTNLLAFTAMALTQALKRHAEAGEAEPAYIAMPTVVARVLPYWKKLLALTACAAVLAYAAALTLPRQWRTSASMMVYNDPPQELNPFGPNDPFSAAMADRPGAPDGKEALRVLAALRSKQAIYNAFEETGLLPALFPERWDAAQNKWRESPPSPTAVYEKVWERHIFVDFFPKSGRLRVTAQWYDGKTTAALADALVRQGDMVAAGGIMAFQAKKRKALDLEVVALADSLKKAEEDLLAFRTQESLIDPDYQSAAALALRGDLAEMRVKSEVERGKMAGVYAPTHPRSLYLAASIASIDSVAAKMGEGAYDYLPGLTDLPALTMIDRRLKRDRDLKEKHLMRIAPLALDWRVRSETAEPMIVAYEPAIEPTRRYFPARTLFAFAAAAFAGYLALVYLFVSPYFFRRNA